MSLAVNLVTGHSFVTEQRSQAVIIKPMTRSLEQRTQSGQQHSRRTRPTCTASFYSNFFFKVLSPMVTFWESGPQPTSLSRTNVSPAIVRLCHTNTSTPSDGCSLTESSRPVKVCKLGFCFVRAALTATDPLDSTSGRHCRSVHRQGLNN